jgi:hypothetical protein
MAAGPNSPPPPPRWGSVGMGVMRGGTRGWEDRCGWYQKLRLEARVTLYLFLLAGTILGPGLAYCRMSAPSQPLQDSCHHDHGQHG